MTMASPETDGFEGRLNDWLANVVGVEYPRRVARVDDSQVLVSKFEPGFAANLHELLDLMPELFDRSSVLEAYSEEASSLPAGISRVEAWRSCMHRMLRRAGDRHNIPDLRQAEVRTAIDSVGAVLATALWSDPCVGDDYEPLPGEIAAYTDGVSMLHAERDIFTRHYGNFEGRSVVNHCPGAAFARVMLADAWRTCTGTEPAETVD